MKECIQRPTPRVAQVFTARAGVGMSTEIADMMARPRNHEGHESPARSAVAIIRRGLIQVRYYVRCR